MAGNPVRITVLKRLSNPDLIDRYGVNVVAQCGVMKDGQQFISEGLKIPDGFCAWAWADIQRDATVLALGGNFPWINEEGVTIACCTDGLRPVVFKLERITP